MFVKKQIFLMACAVLVFSTTSSALTLPLVRRADLIPSEGMRSPPFRGVSHFRMIDNVESGTRPGSRDYLRRIIADKLSPRDLHALQDIPVQANIFKPGLAVQPFLRKRSSRRLFTTGREANNFKNSPPTTDVKGQTEATTAHLGAGEKLGIEFVNLLYNINPIRSLLGHVARVVMADNARRFGVDWGTTSSQWRLRIHELEEEFMLLNSNPTYPDYYLSPFHAYELGNLNWDAAFEVEAATLALTLRYWPAEVKSGTLKAREAQDRVRHTIVSKVKEYWGKGGKMRGGPKDICDIGCSVGISTKYIADAHSETAKSLTGLDLSPHYLSVATLRARQSLGQEPASRLFRESKFVHSAAEYMHQRLGMQSKDLIYSQFLFHELPTEATRAIMKSMWLTLRAGGVVAIADVDVERMIKRSSPALIALFQITEPFFKEYAMLDLERELIDAGFTDVQTVLTDPKNRLVLARRP
jgi:SAM-dependent methyltransferase